MQMLDHDAERLEAIAVSQSSEAVFACIGLVCAFLLGTFFGRESASVRSTLSLMILP